MSEHQWKPLTATFTGQGVEGGCPTAWLLDGRRPASFATSLTVVERAVLRALCEDVLRDIREADST